MLLLAAGHCIHARHHLHACHFADMLTAYSCRASHYAATNYKYQNQR